MNRTQDNPSVVRQTVERGVSVSGVGIHTGAEARVFLHPAPWGQGVTFLQGKQSIPALASSVVDTSRCTVLGQNGVTVSTVEHLLSACAGLGVTDVTVEVQGPELPIGDGSANLWVEALQSADLKQGPLVAPIHIPHPVLVSGKGGAFIVAYPLPPGESHAQFTYAGSWEHPLVQTQVARFEPVRERYDEIVAPARTFGFIEEVEALLKAGLAKGGSFDTALVVYSDHYSAPLRFGDELARHKLLDLMGDLFLCGITGLVADIIAVRSGHRLNIAFANALRKAVAPNED
jgi:UDP-3-O-[3-hydroxymyristoyl] N-acetylglucosamine deacetylase